MKRQRAWQEIKDLAAKSPSPPVSDPGKLNPAPIKSMLGRCPGEECAIPDDG